MGASRSHINWNPFASARPRRRRLIHCLLATATIIGITAIVTLGAQESHRVIAIYMPPNTPAQSSVVIPTPQFLPAGYELFRVFREPIDGFGTGNAEIEFDYIDKSCWTRGKICPLQVFVSPITTNPFAGTVGRKSELLSLWIGNRTVEAQYFIGSGNLQPEREKPRSNRQRPRPDASDFNASLNSLVFPFDGFMIGIRGSKLGGVGRSELIKVAKSLTYTVRP